MVHRTTGSAPFQSVVRRASTPEMGLVRGCANTLFPTQPPVRPPESVLSTTLPPGPVPAFGVRRSRLDVVITGWSRGKTGRTKEA